MNTAQSRGRCTVRIENRRGLHARASAMFVRMSEMYDANVSVSKDGMEVSGQSIMGLLLLAAAFGEEIEICADGPEAEAVLAALSSLVERRFEEDD